MRIGAELVLDQPGRLRGTELDTLWEQAIRQLAAFAAPTAPGEAPGQPGTTRPPFGKRAR